MKTMSGTSEPDMNPRTEDGRHYPIHFDLTEQLKYLDRAGRAEDYLALCEKERVTCAMPIKIRLSPRIGREA